MSIQLSLSAFTRYTNRKEAGVYDIGKRGLDMVGAATLLILAAPAMLIIAVAVRLTMGMPILFVQDRPGRSERLFRCLKFRTMREARDPSGNLLSDAERLTALGGFLRRTSLDELPQLWNILKGDLSFVGPRPLFARYLPYYTNEERRRHSVRPGLTGWAQINGRNCVPFDKRLEMDVWYVDHRSFYLDIRILITTAWIVLRQRGFEMENVPLDVMRAMAITDSHTSINTDTRRPELFITPQNMNQRGKTLDTNECARRSTRALL